MTWQEWQELRVLTWNSYDVDAVMTAYHKAYATVEEIDNNNRPSWAQDFPFRVSCIGQTITRKILPVDRLHEVVEHPPLGLETSDVEYLWACIGMRLDSPKEVIDKIFAYMKSNPSCCTLCVDAILARPEISLDDIISYIETDLPLDVLLQVFEQRSYRFPTEYLVDRFERESDGPLRKAIHAALVKRDLIGLLGG